MRSRSTGRGMFRPASIMPSIAASTASAFIFMKSVSVLSRSRTMARITRSDSAGASLRGGADGAAQADLAVVDSHVEATHGVRAHPGLVGDRRALAPVVRQRQQHAVFALAALGKVPLRPH